MFRIVPQGIKSTGRAQQLLEYLSQENIYVNKNDQGSYSSEEFDKYLKREELSQDDYDEKFSLPLDMMAEELELLLSEKLDMDMVIRAAEDEDEKVRPKYVNETVIKREHERALTLADSYEQYVELMKSKGYKIDYDAEGTMYFSYVPKHGKPSEEFKIKVSGKYLNANDLDNKITRKVRWASKLENPDYTPPSPEEFRKMKPDLEEIYGKELTFARYNYNNRQWIDSQTGEIHFAKIKHVDKKTGKVYTIDPRKGLLNKIVAELFGRDKNLERQLRKEAEAKYEAAVEKLELRQQKADEKFTNFAKEKIIELSVKYDIHTSEMSSAVEYSLQAQVDHLDHEIELLQKSRFRTSDVVVQEKIQEKINELQAERYECLTDYTQIKNVIKPYLKNLEKNEPHRLQDLSKLMDSEKEALRQIRNEKKLADEIKRKEQTKVRVKNRIKKDISKVNSSDDRISKLLEDMKSLDEEKKNYIKLTKCKSELTITHNVDNAKTFVDEMVEDNLKHGKPVPTEKEEKLLCKQMILTPDPKDKVSPELMRQITTEFINNTSLADHKIVAVIHTDHPDRGPHAQLMVSNYSTDRMYTKDGQLTRNPIRSFQDGAVAKKRGDDNLHDYHRKTMEIYLEHGLYNSIQHNPVYQQELKKSMAKKFQFKSNEKLIQTAIVEGTMQIKREKDVFSIQCPSLNHGRPFIISAKDVSDLVKVVDRKIEDNALIFQKTEMMNDILQLHGKGKKKQKKKEIYADIDKPSVTYTGEDKIRAEIKKVLESEKVTDIKSFKDALKSMDCVVRDRADRNAIYFEQDGLRVSAQSIDLTRKEIVELIDANRARAQVAAFPEMQKPEKEKEPVKSKDQGIERSR